MAILINKKTRVLVSGMTGKEGTFHSRKMLDMGTNIVCGVTPGKGGTTHLGKPIYNSVKDALVKHELDACGIFVPSKFTMAAANEAVDGGINLIIVIAEGISPHDSLKFISKAKKNNVILIGPNTPGLLTPGESKIGVLATEYVQKGNIGVISRSGTLTVEICYYLVKEGLGQSTIVGLGGDPVVGSTFKEMYKLFEKDKETRGVVVVGEIGGTMEEELAEYILQSQNKIPTVAFIAGQNAPPGKRMGHAGAIIEGGMGSADSKIEALKKAGVSIAKVPWETGKLMKDIL
ncbi:MAG: succinate--CoA ligase subunit alpha [Elusimicrobia bacterium HGW-Elusimicrobia-2]|nr:MAG: succinate--CoA ligase subunit alpha [Elusimicrobia bacterium HGW-Elusimicrobia-2]